MFNKVLAKFQAKPPQVRFSTTAMSGGLGQGIMRTTYTSLPIPIPATFLTSPPAEEVVLKKISFAETAVPEFARLTAFVLENVLSLEECGQLLALAESSVPPGEGDAPGSASASEPWKPALVSVGPGLEGAAPDYRNSDRIIWDQQEVVDRIWARCEMAVGAKALVEDVPWAHRIQGGRWTFRCLNERMRFLKYVPGMFFKPHCDGAYTTTKDGKTIETHYTLQLYLNDEGLEGGATSFLSSDRRRRVDVQPRAGSVLIFQHEGLYHEGATVTAGVKYAMRTDIMYQWDRAE